MRDDAPKDGPAAATGPPGSRPQRRRRIVASAAAVALGALGALLVWLAADGGESGDPENPLQVLPAEVLAVLGRPSVSDETLSPETEIPEGATLVTPTRSAVHFRVGTRIDVVLDRGSRMRLRTLRVSTVRLVLEHGVVRARARTLTPRQTLVVSVGRRRVEARGTVFQVRAERGKLVFVAVLDGKITVDAGDPEATVVDAGESWRSEGGTRPIEEREARVLAAFVAGRPWVAPP